MFITFEGIDFCGKSTQLMQLKLVLTSKGFRTLVIREPGGEVVSEKIREILLDTKNDIDDRCELLLFSAARAQLVQKVIIPALKDNIIVLSDRFFDSSVAYQGGGRGFGIHQVMDIQKFAIDLIKPDLTFLLDIPVHTMIDRRVGITKLDRIEQGNYSFFKQIRQAYLLIHEADPERVVLIDGTLPTAEIALIIQNKVQEKLKF